MMQFWTKKLSLLPLFMVILLDVMGIILVMPVITPLILDHNSLLISAQTSPFWRDFMYGFALSLFPFFMFLSTPILGDLSDRFGRKKILILCLIVTTISYILSAIAIAANNLLWLLISRAVAGLAAGTQPIATAGILDLSSLKERTKNLSSVVFAVSIGLILGPLLGGITAEKSVVSWFDYKTPFIVAGILSALNALLLHFVYHEKNLIRPQKSIQLMRGLVLFAAAFSEKKFRFLSSMTFFFVLSWSLYYQTINWFLNQVYFYNVGRLGLFIGFIGIIFAVTSTIGIRFLTKYFKNEIAVFAVSVLIMGIANIGAAICHGEIAQWFWVIFVAATDVICYTLSMSIFSKAAGQDAQGWVMGVTGAIYAMTWTVGGLIVGPLGAISLQFPFWIGGILCFVSFILAWWYGKNEKLA